jgi:DNA repair and recombination protein RAD52
MEQALVPTMDTSLTYGFESSQIEELSKPLNQTLIKERRGPKDKETGQYKMLKYLTGKTAIDTANRIFGVGKWGYRVLNRSREVVGDKEFYTADIELYVLGCPFPFPGEGEGIPLYDTPAEHAKARKEAVTDALKRALRHFGDQFGLCLYDEDSLVEDSNGNLTQVKNVHPQNGNKSVQGKRTVDAIPTEPTIGDIKALCDEVLGPGKWGALRGKVLNPEEIGDVPDDLLSASQKARLHGALVAHQRQKAAKAAK